MLKVLAFATAKGGSGKSTLAISLAVAAQETGERVCLVDMDRQESASAWSVRRIEGQGKAEDQPLVVRASPTSLQDGIRGLEELGVTLAVIDTAGRDEAETGIVMGIAHGCVIPVKASILDLESCVTTAERLDRLKKPFRFVINEAEPKADNARNAGVREALEGQFGGRGLVVDTLVVRRADHRDAIAAGLGVTELDPKGKAATEIRALLAEIMPAVNQGVADVA